MKIYAQHKSGYLYEYDSMDETDRELWFEGRNDIVQAFNMEARDNGSEYPTLGMNVKLEYVDGIMDGVTEYFNKCNAMK